MKYTTGGGGNASTKPVPELRRSRGSSLDTKPSIDATLPRPKTSKTWQSTIWFADDPGFVPYIRQEWLNLLTIATLLLIPLFLHNFAHPLGTHYFPLQQGGQLLAPQYAYPLRDEYINTPVSAIISFVIPFAFIGLCCIFLIGNFWDSNSALMGLGFALCTANFFQIILKFFIGGLRPNFYEACRPMTSTGGVGYQNIYYTRSICTNPSRREVSTALLSFPSGHCAAAFAGFGYLALWINAKFKVCADYKSSHWQHALLALPLCVAALLALSKIADYWHHWWDVLAGSLIGMFFAWLSYRQMYWSVFDWQYNHIPLPYPGQLATSTPILVPTRDLTCINWAGWKNKHSDKYMVEKEKELSQVDGAHEEGMGSRHRFDLTHFLV